MLELIKSLSQAYGPAGREDRVRELIKDSLPAAENIIEDALGNVIFVKRGSGKKIMVAAHMDEVGVIVTDIDEHGFLRLAPVGGVSAYSVLGKRFVFQSGVAGVVAVEKIENLNKLTYKELYLDIGAANKEEAVEKISIGELGVYEGSFAVVNNRLLSKALDDRVGCAILLEALKEIETDNEIYFVFTVQEELGLRGAITAAYRLNPDYGLAVDVTVAGDTPEIKHVPLYLGKGPAVKIKDSSIMSHPRVKEKMIQTAESNGIPYQLEILARGGTDAGSIHLSREGVPAGVLSIPCRYLHSPAEMVDINDVQNGVKLLKKLLEINWD